MSAKSSPDSAGGGGGSSFSLFHWVYMGAAAYLVFTFASAAYQIRMGAIDEYGPVIHEFDPYFNYRATEYLYWNGWERFSQWFDYMSWYPLGRPVGTTIYPGMQVTAVWIKHYILLDWSINDICCYIPVWYGVMASILTGLIAYEATIPENSSNSVVGFVTDIMKGDITKIKTKPSSWTSTPALECFIVTLGLMAIVPAHLMRSIGGGYDNESIAMTAMVLTFYLWMRSIRTGNGLRDSVLFGFLTAVGYFYMVAAWGGYVFVLNMVGVHAAALVCMGRFQTNIYVAYSIFYFVGTALAMQIPVVGWTPVKSLEQLGPCAVFLGYQLLFFTEWIRKSNKLTRMEAWKLRVQAAAVALLVLALGVFFLAPKGYFGPLSSRVRGLFVKHTKTGNPLVDSVAEHQAASPKAYFQYLHHVCSLAPMGYIVIFFKLSDSASFLLVWGAAAYFFSHKMVRLILLTAPIGCVLAGILGGRLLAWSLQQFMDQTELPADEGVERIDTTKGESAKPKDAEDTVVNPAGARAAAAKRKKKKQLEKQNGGGGSKKKQQSSFDGVRQLQEAVIAALNTKEGVSARRFVAVIIVFLTYALSTRFIPYCFALSQQLSHPTVIQKARTRDGQIVMIDDYRDAYFWLKDNTPEDARIMAWWDYGYQIAGIANRTTIADGNTWNHEHIALLGKALTTELNEGYEIARHWADYVLVWAGGGGDDLAKSPHLARIANSVYRDHCPDDPTCRAFGFVDRQGTPSPMMRRSFLYTLHSSGTREGVTAPEDKFQEVYRSKYGKVRIWKILGVSQESRDWASNPSNRKCDVPGSWYCPGSYPPGLNSVLSKKKDFKQLEDFNKGSGDDEYTKQYFENLRDPASARRKAQEKEKQEEAGNSDEETPAPQKPSVSEEEIQRRKQMLYEKYEDTEQSTMMWEFIHNGNIKAIRSWLNEEPWWAFLRSGDGRGPMWWSFEERNNEIVQYLMRLGVPHNDRDSEGLTPADLQTKA